MVPSAKTHFCSLTRGRSGHGKKSVNLYESLGLNALILVDNPHFECLKKAEGKLI